MKVIVSSVSWPPLRPDLSLETQIENSTSGIKGLFTWSGGSFSFLRGDVTVIWASPRFGHPHSLNPGDMGIPCNPNPNPNQNR